MPKTGNKKNNVIGRGVSNKRFPIGKIQISPTNDENSDENLFAIALTNDLLSSTAWLRMFCCGSFNESFSSRRLLFSLSARESSSWVCVYLCLCGARASSSTHSHMLSFSTMLFHCGVSWAFIPHPFWLFDWGFSLFTSIVLDCRCCCCCCCCSDQEFIHISRALCIAAITHSL